MKLKFFTPILLSFALAACSTPEQKQAAAEQAIRLQKIDDSYVPVTYVSIACDGHADIPVTGYSVQDLISTREYGGGSCGGINAAGYPLPRQWRPGMKVKVSWKLDGQPWRKTTTNIMRYDSAETLFIHIYNNDQVRVVSAKAYPGSPKHPISGDSTIPPPEEE